MNVKAATPILDITRLAGRVGRGPLTGIDRVERAYLAALAAPGEALFLCQTRGGCLILGPEAASDLLAWADGAPLPAGGPFGGLRGQTPAIVHLARRALVRTRAGETGRWLRGRGFGSASYLNVGHLALDGPLIAQLGAAGLQRTAMVHDTIPLDHPEWSGAGAPARFRAQLLAALHADLIVTPTRIVAADVARWADRLGARQPRMLTAAPGVAPAAPNLGAVPPFDRSRPYFVALGTIEPRKDHALLLDIWQDFHDRLPDEAIPRLIIAGRRGWRNEALFRRLDSACFMGRTVLEWAGLTDGAVAALLLGSAGLLSPSRAEGFGLPAAEAAALGVPVVAADLPVTREVLGSYPIYAPPGDLYAWSQTITTLARQADTGQRRADPATVPDWAAHFDLVLGRTGTAAT